jgi:hypothetical protein
MPKSVIALAIVSAGISTVMNVSAAADNLAVDGFGDGPDAIGARGEIGHGVVVKREL